MKIKKKIRNIIGILIVRYIIGNDLKNNTEGWLVTRKNGTQQVIKVFSKQAYENVVRPVIKGKEDVKEAEFVGYITYNKEKLAEWRCPNKKCGMGVSEEYTCCPYCGQKLKFREPKPVKTIQISIKADGYTVRGLPESEG